MRFSGNYELIAPRAEVWSALNDTEVLRQAIPGCQVLEKISDTSFNATVKSKVGPLSATFKTDIALEDVCPPESYTLIAKASGGAIGMGHAETQVSLAELEGKTRLDYTVELKVRGKLAQIGSRLLSNSIKKLSDEFFTAFASHFDE